MSQSPYDHTERGGSFARLSSKATFSHQMFTAAAWWQIPRVELAEMGPALDLALRRHRTPAPDLEKEALKQAKLSKKKVLPCAVGVRASGLICKLPALAGNWARRSCSPASLYSPAHHNQNLDTVI